MSKIDILLPFWGDIELAKKTVESVLAQTNPNWRLLIFDDCYPSDLPKKYFTSIKDPRVSYFRHQENLGITKNFNFTVSRAESEYCVLVGCDDRLLPNYVETALKNIGDADFYQPRVQVIDGGGNVYLPLTDRVKRILSPKKPGIYSGEKLATSLCHGNWLYFPSITWKTSTLKKYQFDARYKILEDVIVELDMILDGAKLYLDNTETFQYRRFAGSLSSKEKTKNGVRFDEEAEVYANFADKFRQAGWPKAARAAKARITSRINQLLS